MHRFPPRMNFSNRYTVHFDIKCDFMRWLNAHRDYYRGCRSAASIAVWRARENMALSGKLAYAATMRLEQCSSRPAGRLTLFRRVARCFVALQTGARAQPGVHEPEAD